MSQAITNTSPRAPVSSGYADVNGIKLYLVSAAELAPIIDKYLADPLTNRRAGAAAASQAAPELTTSD